jgi:hypothetical protein
MSKSAIGTGLWDEMSEAQKIEAVTTGTATLKEMVEGLLDGPSPLREACRSVLANSDVCLERIQQPEQDSLEHSEPTEPLPELDDERSEEEIATTVHSAAIENARKRRQGLPEGYVPRQHKH